MHLYFIENEGFYLRWNEDSVKEKWCGQIDMVTIVECAGYRHTKRNYVTGSILNCMKNKNYDWTMFKENKKTNWRIIISHYCDADLNKLNNCTRINEQLRGHHHHRSIQFDASPKPRIRVEYDLCSHKRSNYLVNLFVHCYTGANSIASTSKCDHQVIQGKHHIFIRNRNVIIINFQ